MTQVEQDIKEIKVAMLKHFTDDSASFGELKDLIAENHDIHIRNEEILKATLVQTTKTNGRVTSLEDICQRMDKQHALLCQIVSQQHSQYEKFVTQQEKLKESAEVLTVSRNEFIPVKNIVFGGVAFILTGVLGALLALILK